ncbi:hypothetical protein BJX62DRAFT_240467 [Aspergillus germanicus]
MPSTIYLELDDEATTTRLFRFPNDGHANKSLQETIEHYINASMRREGVAEWHISANITADRCTVAITLDEQGATKPSLLTAKRAYRLRMPFGRAGPETKRGRFSCRWDYLDSKTTRRWWELLALNGVPDEERARYSCILDIVPVAAPARDGEKLRQAGIYNGPFDSYAVPLFELLVVPSSDSSESKPRQYPYYRPLIALGLPIRVWMKRVWNLSLGVLDTGTIDLDESGATCNVIAANHPSFFYYAVRSNTGPDAEKKNLATGLAEMKQDIVAAAWHAEMGRNPGADPSVALRMSAQKWQGREEDLLDLVKMQAGLASERWTSTDVSLAAVMRFMPAAAELEELERQFYYSGNVQDRTEQAVSGSPNADGVLLSTIGPFVPTDQELEER